MKHMNGQQLFDIVGKVDADLIDDALPPSHAALAGKAPARRLHPLRSFTRFANTGLGAAVISGVVAIGVLTAIIVAGQTGGPGTGPAGDISTPDTNREELRETDTSALSTTPGTEPEIVPEQPAPAPPNYRPGAELSLTADGVTYRTDASVLGGALGTFSVTDEHKSAMDTHVSCMGLEYHPGILYSETATLLLDAAIHEGRLLQISVTDFNYKTVALFAGDALEIKTTDAGVQVGGLSSLPDGNYYMFIRLAFAGAEKNEAVGYDFPFVLVKRPAQLALPLTVVTGAETVTVPHAYTRLTNEMVDMTGMQTYAPLPKDTLALAKDLPTITAYPQKMSGAEGLSLFYVAAYSATDGAALMSIEGSLYAAYAQELFPRLPAGEYILIVHMIDDRAPSPLRNDACGFAVGDYEYAIRLVLAE